ncbi:HAD family hydrolase [Aureimonas leprariae]|uniref:HAD family hydrolase n=1 Tax=Plantimonas leprariae TaxID=2615207 RepID=A0A7V7TVC9_9HYPH|nr:HAD family hydrolase [Aureimonas leprariae]KAB0677360.1 HAD family hydrolase [Aureimonas leprariae]
MPPSAILFDIDGTLVDSNDFHVEAWDEAFRRAGHEFDAETLHDQIGKGSDTLVPTLLPDIGEDEREAIGEAHGEIFKAKFIDRVRPFPAARELMERAHAAGQKVVLASSASKAELDHYLDLLDARAFVAATTSIDDVETSKPAPDIFGTALKKLGSPPPDEVVVVGDTPYDIEAAAKCGLRTVALLSGKFPEASLQEAGAVAIYADVAALLADYDASPCGANAEGVRS